MQPGRSAARSTAAARCGSFDAPGAAVAVAVAGGVVYVAGSGLRAFDAARAMGCSGTPKTCSPRRMLKFGGPDTSVVIANGAVYFVDDAGLHAYATS